MSIVKVSRAAVEKALAETDWAAIDAMTDEDIARQVADNPDAAPLMADNADLTKRRRVIGRPRKAVGGMPAAVAAPGAIHRVGGKAIPVSVQGLRTRLGMTQAEFAKAYGFTTSAVRSIEQGKRQPSGPTKALLMLIDRDPEFVRQTLAKAV